jgi:homoserine kinase type II
MNYVFLLYYVIDEDDENQLLIGVYGTENEAKVAIERLKDRPGFVDAPEKFLIVGYELNRDHWTEGFKFTDD